jgi:hypothetical protein
MINSKLDDINLIFFNFSFFVDKSFFIKFLKKSANKHLNN